jgi:hypothetical protein
MSLSVKYGGVIQNKPSLFASPANSLDKKIIIAQFIKYFYFNIQRAIQFEPDSVAMILITSCAYFESFASI